MNELRMYLIFRIALCVATLLGLFTCDQNEDLRTRHDIEEIRRWIQIDSKNIVKEIAALNQQMRNKDSEIERLKESVAKEENRQTPIDDTHTSSKRLVLHSDEDLALKVTELTGKLQTTESKLQALESTVSKLQATELKLHNLEANVSKLQATELKLQSTESKLHTLETTVSKLQTKSTGGQTYVRWGRTDCPANGTELVYKGYAGGSLYSETGGGVNYLCLSDDPIYEHFESGQQSNRANLYGAEYEFGQGDTASTISFVHKNLFNDNAPCAVCRTTRSSVLMIPGRNACTAGWTMEYKGYLTSGVSVHVAASEFICLDNHPEAVPSGHNDENGKLFYFVEGRCGSLECPPYVDGQELTCAVCSK